MYFTLVTSLDFCLISGLFFNFYCITAHVHPPYTKATFPIKPYSSLGSSQSDLGVVQSDWIKVTGEPVRSDKGSGSGSYGYGYRPQTQYNYPPPPSTWAHYYSTPSSSTSPPSYSQYSQYSKYYSSGYPSYLQLPQYQPPQPSPPTWSTLYQTAAYPLSSSLSSSSGTVRWPDQSEHGYHSSYKSY